MCDVTEVKGGKKYKLVPPDGGWGYMIWVSTIINNISVQSILACFGLIFNDFMVELEIDSTTVAIINGVNSVFFAVAGYTTHVLSKVLSWRQISLLGSVLMTSCHVGCLFCKSQITFCLFQGLQLAGVGYLTSVSCTQINDYFLEKRLLSISFTQTVTALIASFAPMFFKWCLETYGFRGTLLMVIGITLQNFVATMLLQPAEWHLKKVPISEDEEEENLLVGTNAVMKTEDKKQILVLSMNGTEITEKNHIDKDQTHDLESTKVLEKPRGIMQKISDALDLSLFKRLAVVSATFGSAVAFFGDTTFSIMLPQALYFIDWNESSVAWAMTLMCIGDVSTKLCLITFNNCLTKLGYRVLFMIGLVIAIVTRIGMILSNQQLITLIFLTLMGVSRCLFITLIPLVLSETVSQDLYASVLGMYMLLFCVSSITIGPFIGLIRDITHSYNVSFSVLTALYATVLILWTIEICYRRSQIKRQRQKLKPKINIEAK